MLFAVDKNYIFQRAHERTEKKYSFQVSKFRLKQMGNFRDCFFFLQHLHATIITAEHPNETNSYIQDRGEQCSNSKIFRCFFVSSVCSCLIFVGA